MEMLVLNMVLILEEGDGGTYLTGWARSCWKKYFSGLVNKIYKYYMETRAHTLQY